MIYKLTRYIAVACTIFLLFSCSKLITGKSTPKEVPSKSPNEEVVVQDDASVEKPISPAKPVVLTGKTREDLTVKKQAYNIALLLPFCVESTLDSNFNGVEDLQAITVASADFYDGVKMALEEFRRAGVNFKLHVFDTDKYTNEIDTLIFQDKLRGMDLVIGPFYTHQAAALSNYIQYKQIPLILPVSRLHH